MNWTASYTDSGSPFNVKGKWRVSSADVGVERRYATMEVHE